MHITQETGARSPQQSVYAKSHTPARTAKSDGELSQAERISLDHVQSRRFATAARVGGYLLRADIGPNSFGFLYGADLPLGENFVSFEAIGFDSRGGYDLVRSASGLAYVIVTYALHARERGLDHLASHIGANPDHYAARSLILGKPWPHTQAMIDQLEAGWRRHLPPQYAQNA